MNGKNLCYNCFKEKPQPEGPCPYCGFDLAENQEKFPMALKAGTVLNSRYILGRVLGQGGFGITYVAWDKKLAARVAVKEYMPGELAARMDGKTLSVMTAARRDDFAYGQERFREEARILAKFMGQPNIAGVTDYFDENGTSYFVMDYIEGISFKTYIANQGGKVSPEETLDVMIPVLRALTAVHAEGFIHRDVTPDNIYITKDGNVKLLDFGSARYSLGDKSKSLDVILKVGYAPKEQYIRRGRQGPYTDVYSCAACLYAAITGYLPPESLERLDHDSLVPPSQMGVEIPLYLERAILKGLAVQPEDRFQTAGEFLEALERQQVVELPGNMPGQGDAGQGAAGEGRAGQKAARPKAKKKLLPLILGGAAAIALVFAAGTFLGGGGFGPSPQAAGSGSLQPGGQGEEAGAAAEKEAPKVTLAGEEYSTAETELDLSGKGLTDGDLVNLAQMTDLKSLDLKGNEEISDLSPLSGLTSLEKLSLPLPSKIRDLSPLSGLTNMKEFSISGDWRENPPVNEIKDFSPLASLSQMEDLVMVVTDLQDLSFLSGMTGLTRLKISGTVLTADLTALKGLTHLKELNLDTYGLQSLSGLEGMADLEMLEIADDAGSTFVRELSSLKDLTDLRVLRFRISGYSSYNTDLASLSGLTNLEELIVPGGDGTVELDLTPLANLKHLRILNTGCNAVDLGPLSGLKELTELDLENGGFGPTSGNVEYTSLAPLAGLENLTSLTIRNRHVSDLTPLSGLKNLRSLTIHNAGSITDLTPLSALPELKDLSISAARQQLDTSSLTQVERIRID